MDFSFSIILTVIVAFAIAFSILWCFVLWLLSLVGGWKDMAKKYAAQNITPSGDRFSWETGLVGVVSYRSTLIVYVNESGFFLEVLPIFRFCHPRLFIPYLEITSREPVQLFWWEGEKLTVGNPKIAAITLPRKIIRAMDAK